MHSQTSETPFITPRGYYRNVAGELSATLRKRLQLQRALYCIRDTEISYKGLTQSYTIVLITRPPASCRKEGQDQKLKINLEWPYCEHKPQHKGACESEAIVKARRLQYILIKATSSNSISSLVGGLFYTLVSQGGIRRDIVGADWRGITCIHVTCYRDITTTVETGYQAHTVI